MGTVHGRAPRVRVGRHGQGATASILIVSALTDCTERVDRVDLIPPPDGDGLAARADAYAAAPLLNCLLRELAEPVADSGGLRTYRLPGGARLLRVRGTRRPADPEVFAAGRWHRLGHTELVKLVAEELRRHTGLSNHDLPAEMIDSREAVAALLAARARAEPPA